MRLPFFQKKKTVEIPEKIFELEEMKVIDFVAPASIKVEPSCLRLGERLTKSFFIFSYPRYLSTAWFSPVINLDTPMDISFFLHPIDTGLVLKQLRKRVTEVQAEIMEREEKGLIRDPTLETAFRDLEELRDKLQTAQERMFKFGLYLTVYADNEEELRKIETTLRSILESRLIYIKPALYQQKEGFISTGPYGLDQLQVHTLMNTEPLSSVFPFISFDLSSNEGILFGVNQHNNSLVLFDRFSLENANSTIFAKSGAGKSMKRDTPVLIKNKQEIQLTKIGPLVENLIKKQGVTKIDEELEGVINPEIKVYSFDQNLKGEWSKVTVAARKKAPKAFYRFTTRSGREITTTGDHNMLILRNGNVIAAKSSEIKEGEFVPLPRFISETDSPTKFFNLLELLKKSKGVYVEGIQNIIRENYKALKQAPFIKKHKYYLRKYSGKCPIPICLLRKILKYLGIKLNDQRLRKSRIISQNKKVNWGLYFPITESFLKVLGFIAAEGTVTKNYILIATPDFEIEARREIKNFLNEYNIPFYERKKEIIIGTQIFVELIKALGGRGKSGQKRVFPFIFNLERKKIGQYLSAYFEGDGTVNDDEKNVEATSKSKRLIQEITYLLYYFGIIARISKRKIKNKKTKRKRTYWIVRISNKENLEKFNKEINFISERKKQLLLRIIVKEGGNCIDFIPDLEKLFQEIHQLFSFQLHYMQQIVRWGNAQRKPSPQQLSKVINQIEEKIQYFKDLSSTFKILNELPELNAIISLGKSNKNLNKELRKNLGWTWGLMKNQIVKSRCSNVFKATEIVSGNSYSLSEIKRAIYLGFKEIDLPYYNSSLHHTLVADPKRDTSYETIQKAAQCIWQNYQDILMNKIPKVEEKLAQLKILANSDLFWDPIVGIKKNKNKKEEYVYDLTVNNEVFLAGQGGMFVHNSYAVKLEILRSLMLGVECIIIDPENEYRWLADTVGGSFFNISLASPNHINPFDLPLPREDEKAEDVLRSSIINLVGLLRIMLGGLTPEEDAIMDRALAETYAAKDITPETDPNLWRKNLPLMSDLEAVLEGMEGAESLLKRIRKFTKGTYAQFFNQPTNISMEKNLVVFGIRDMEDELRPMAMFMIMRYIWNKVRSELKKRILVIDEAWWLMQTEDGASFLFGICKRARKYWLGVTTITQDVGDFMRSAYGRPIITNSSLQFLMKQSSATIDIVQKIFNLTEEEKYMLLEAAVGEGLFFAGQKHVALRTVASYAEDQIITTAPEEILKIKKAKKELEK